MKTWRYILELFLICCYEPQDKLFNFFFVVSSYSAAANFTLNCVPTIADNHEKKGSRRLKSLKQSNENYKKREKKFCAIKFSERETQS